MTSRTIVEKIWDAHIVARLGGGLDLLHVDRHLVHDLSGPPSLGVLAERGLPVRNPELTFAMPDHTVSTAVGRTDADSNAGRMLLPALRERTHAEGIRLFDLDDAEQGIVHVVGPELGLTLPGITVLCGDSHTCTHGGLGALGWGIGSSDLTHVLATQTIVQRRPKQMRVTCSGGLASGVEPKDLVLHLIGEHGADGGTGFAVEYAGSAIASMPVEGRMTLCNLTMEFGAKIGIVAPDESTFDYLAGRRYAPTGARWDLALAAWRDLPSDEGAAFDREIEIDAAAVSPQITWGTSPAHTMALDARIPDPAQAHDPRSSPGPQQGARVHGPELRRAAARASCPARVHRLLREQPAVGPEDSSTGSSRPSRCARRARVGGAGLSQCASRGRGARARPHLHGSRL